MPAVDLEPEALVSVDAIVAAAAQQQAQVCGTLHSIGQRRHQHGPAASRGRCRIEDCMEQRWNCSISCPCAAVGSETSVVHVIYRSAFVLVDPLCRSGNSSSSSASGSGSRRRRLTGMLTTTMTTQMTMRRLSSTGGPRHSDARLLEIALTVHNCLSPSS